MIPKFSVIIPTYNRSPFVVEAIDSVLHQRLQDFEIIVVDDGSSDDTRGVLLRYGEEIRYIHQENAGVSAARNTGIRAARGAWIAFLDSDDVWRSEYLSAQARQIAAYPLAVAHIVNSAYVWPGEETKPAHFEEIGVLQRFQGGQSLYFEKPFRFIIAQSHWFLQGIVMRRDILMQTQLLDTSLTIAEDMDLLARMALKGPISFCREVLVEIYRREESTASLSAQYFKRGIYSRKAFGKVYSNLLHLPQLTFPEKCATAKALCHIWRALGNVLLAAGRKLEARHYYRKALFLYPSLPPLVKYFGTFLPGPIALLLVRKRVKIAPGDEVPESQPSSPPLQGEKP